MARHGTGGITVAGTLWSTSTKPLSRHELRPTSNRSTRQQRLPLSPRSPPRTASRVQGTKLSSHARSAKIKWESLHGEPCPYSRPASAHTARVMRSDGPGAEPVAVHSGRDRNRYRRVLPAGMPSPHQQQSFGNGFLKAPNVSARQQTFDSAACGDRGVCILGTVRANNATAKHAKRGQGKVPRRKTGKVCQQGNAKPEQWKTWSPTLLAMHRRVIEAALVEISRPREGPFENLGERLGGEHDAFTYCSRDRGVSADSTACGDVSLPVPATGVLGLRASMKKGKRKARAHARNPSRPSTGPTSRPPTAGGKNRPEVLPRFHDHEPWKIPLLRTSWNPSHDDPQTIAGDAFSAIERVGNGPQLLGSDELEPQEEQANASATEASEAVSQRHSVTKLRGENARGDDPSYITDVIALQNATQQLIEGDDSEARKEAPGVTTVSDDDTSARPCDENLAASSLEASAVTTPTSYIVVRQYVEETITYALRAPLRGTFDDSSLGAAAKGMGLKEDTTLGNESRAMARRCSEHIIRRGLQARLAQTFGGGTPGSRIQAGFIDPACNLRPETSSRRGNSMISKLTPTDLLATKDCHTTHCGSSATRLISSRMSGTTTSSLSSDGSAIGFILGEDPSREVEGEQSETSVSFGNGTSHRELHESSPEKIDSSRSSGLSETITGAAVMVVESWVLDVITKGVHPPPPQTATGDKQMSTGYILNQDKGGSERENTAASGGTHEHRTPDGSPGILLTNALPPGFLKDILARRASLRPLAASCPTSAAEKKEEDERLQLQSLLQHEVGADQELGQRAAALRELEILVHNNRLDLYNPAEFSRGMLYGEGRHSVVYRACATNPGGGYNEEEIHGMQSTAAAAVGSRRATAALVATEASAEVLAAAIASALTTVVRNPSVSLKEQALSATFAGAVVESVIAASLSAAAAALAPDNRKSTSTTLAAKEFRYARANVPASILHQAHQEVCMHLRVLSCAQVVALRGVWLTPKVTLLLEPMDGGDLHRFVRAKAAEDHTQNRHKKTCAGGESCEERRRNARWREAARLVAGAAEGLAGLHEAGIVHRDVKSHNVMVRQQQREGTKNGEPIVTRRFSEESRNSGCDACCYIVHGESSWQAKLGDLGSAALIPREEQQALTEEIGTSGWMSPEVSGGHGYGTPSDIFSLGVLIWDAFVCGALDNPMCGALEGELKEGLRPPWPQPPMTMVPQNIERVVERCWAVEPEGRPTAGTVAAELRAFAATAELSLAASVVKTCAVVRNSFCEKG